MATSGSHGGDFVPTGPTHEFGYEPDQFAVKTILAVPGAVIITGLFAFILTWVLFDNIFDPKIQEPPDNPEAARENAAPMNERFARISSTDPKAKYQQPRLEGLEQTEVHERDGYKVDAEMTTTKPTKAGNSLRYHAEDLRADKIPELNARGELNGAVRIPVDEAIAELIRGNHLKPREGAKPLDEDANWDRPKESNGGTGKQPEAAKPPKKKEPEGKDDAKKE